MQRPLLVILIALTAAVTAAAQTVRYPYMAFEKNDGTVDAVAVDGLVMHFTAGTSSSAVTAQMYGSSGRPF